jgi:hypothetical protein
MLPATRYANDSVANSCHTTPRGGGGGGMTTGKDNTARGGVKGHTHAFPQPQPPRPSLGGSTSQERAPTLQRRAWAWAPTAKPRCSHQHKRATTCSHVTPSAPL